MQTDFWVEALQKALARYGAPEIVTAQPDSQNASNEYREKRKNLVDSMSELVNTTWPRTPWVSPMKFCPVERTHSALGTYHFGLINGFITRDEPLLDRVSFRS